MDATDTALREQDSTAGGRLYMAFELCEKSWKISLGDGQRAPSRCTVAAGDTTAVLTAIANARARCPSTLTRPSTAVMRPAGTASGCTAGWPDRALPRLPTSTNSLSGASTRISPAFVHRGRRYAPSLVSISIYSSKTRKARGGDACRFFTFGMPFHLMSGRNAHDQRFLKGASSAMIRQNRVSYERRP
jgi:hypothetical protein